MRCAATKRQCACSCLQRATSSALLCITMRVLLRWPAMQRPVSSSFGGLQRIAPVSCAMHPTTPTLLLCVPQSGSGGLWACDVIRALSLEWTSMLIILFSISAALCVSSLCALLLRGGHAAAAMCTQERLKLVCALSQQPVAQQLSPSLTLSSLTLFFFSSLHL